MKKLKIAIIGQGRSGRDIHGAYLRSEKNTNFEVAYVVDKKEHRRKRALEEYPGCQVFESYQELFDIKDIDFVVNASFSEMHFAITKDLLEHGFNVLCEKPFARTQYECDTLIRIAKEKNVKLYVFQQSFFAPFYLKAKEVIESGKLGDIKQINITYSGFARRWDWQTAQAKMGGSIYNTGPHPIGIALGFLDFDKDFKVAFSKLDTVLTSGDADDFAKIILTAPNKPFVDIEISSNDAYSDYAYKIYGSKGTYVSTLADYKMKYIVDGENPEKPVILDSLETAEGLPMYCGEQLNFHEEEGKISGDAFDVGTYCLYNMIYENIVNGVEITVKPEHASMTINVIERVHADNPLEVKILI